MTPGLVWPTHIESVQFPVQGAGGKSPVSGVILRAPAADAPYQWSEEYLDDWYIGSFSRGWVAQVHLGGDGTTLPELPNWYDHDRTAPDDYAQVLEDGRIAVGVPARVDVSMFADVLHAVIDLRQSPDGALYLIDYGMAWSRPNPEQAIYRIYDASANEVGGG